MSIAHNNAADDFDFIPDDAGYIPAEPEFDFANFEAAFEGAPAPAKTRTTVQAPTPAAAPAPAPAAKQTPPAFNMYGEVPDLLKIPQAATQPLTDFGLGTRFKIHMDDELVFGTAQRGGSWYGFNGRNWVEDHDKSLAESKMRTVIASISTREAVFAAELDENVIEAKDTRDGFKKAGASQSMIDKAQADLDIKTAIAARARTEFGEKCSNGMIHLTAGIRAALPFMSVSASRFDSNPYLINFPNGTMDIREGTALRPHDPKDYLTKVTAVDYVPGATHPDLDKTLAALAKSDPGLPEFLRRYFGVMLSGLNDAKVFMYVKGLNDVGKSTLIEAMIEAMGDKNGSGYGRIVNPKIFALSIEGGDGPQESLHGLKGARGVFADETESGFMNRVTMNVLSAGGTMTTRPLHGHNVSWTSQCKVIFAGNDWMSIPDNDPGITRRLLATEINHRLTPEEMDVTLRDRLKLRPQLEAILAWAVSGLMDWLADGGDKDALRPTPLMLETSANYLSSHDPLSSWWDAYVIEVDEDDKDALYDGTDEDHGKPVGHWVPLTTSQWRTLYVRYCKTHGVKELTEKQFNSRLTAKGFTSLDTSRDFRHEGQIMNKGKFRRGIRHRTQTVVSNFNRADF
jgi:P4 family phage/plasmid primase-like protien